LKEQGSGDWFFLQYSSATVEKKAVFRFFFSRIAANQSFLSNFTSYLLQVLLHDYIYGIKIAF